MPAASPSTQPDPAYVAVNRAVVGRVVARLDATGLLGDQDVDPGTSCREAGKVRDFLNMEIPNVRGGGAVEESFKRMRRSARDFARAAGPDGATYRADPAYFQACLGAMRLTLGDEVAALRGTFSG